MAKRAGGESLAVDVFNRLRSDIFNKRYTPGERLKPAELSERFGVSVGVMREALSLLAAQNLIRVERNRGFHVTTLSPTALAGLTFTRKINEGAALRLSIERGDVAWESDVLAAHHRLASLPAYLPDQPHVRNNEWAAAHIEFHLRLLAACGNNTLLDICRRLSDAAELYRAWSRNQGETKRDLAGEHRRLMEATLAHDADKAVALLEAHLDLTATILLDLESQAANEPRFDTAS